MRSWLLALFLCISIAAAQEYPFDASLYDAETITVRIDVSSAVTLHGSGSAEKLEATVYYVPEEAGPIEAAPHPVSTQPLVFAWRDVRAGTYPFSYSTEVQVSMDRPHIQRAIPYPFTTPSSFTEYLQPREITDTNRAIRNQAQELAAGKTDSVEVVFALAEWVHSNVEYNLSTLTVQASQPSSWVMEQRYGVCDELTSLFISMSREAGIPARFVGGIAYTNQFAQNWGPHGWAEVWLPDIGWIPVDVTYGEIGYVDATHIPIKHSLDAKNTAVDYSLLARRLTMQASELDVQSTVLAREGSVTEPLTLTLEALYENVGSRSSNRLTATVRNNADYYIATDLYLATTPDTVLHEKQRQQVLLPPKSARQVSWRVSHGSFERGYEYTIPFSVISQRAGNASVDVHGNAGGKRYPLMEGASVVSGIPVECEEPPVLYVGEQARITCSAPGARLCAEGCGQDSVAIEFSATEAGAFPRIVSATAGSQQGSAVVTFVVDEPPQPKVSATLPAQASFDDTLLLHFTVETSRMGDAVVEVQGRHFDHRWEVGQLTSKGFELRFPATYLDAGQNELRIVVSGTDKNGKPVRSSSGVPITLRATTWQKLHLFLLHLFV